MVSLTVEGIALQGLGWPNLGNGLQKHRAPGNVYLLLSKVTGKLKLLGGRVGTSQSYRGHLESSLFFLLLLSLYSFFAW